MRAVVAIGATTRATLTSLDVPATIPGEAGFGSVVRHLLTLWNAA
jgi:hypothetical protein